MRRGLEHVGIYLISFEALAVAVALILRLLKPEWLVRIGGLLGQGDLKLGHTLLLLPIALVMATYKWADEIRNPKRKGSKAVLIAWPDYWRLKATTNGGLVYAALGAVGWIAGVSATFLGHVATGPAVALGSLSVAIISAISVAMARLTIKDVLAGG